ncbi:VOC family protein [Mesorhizobium sp. B2-3-13]|uniref:VOC family protein n=1 Tax=Mesorhizobium sp. B2-3-13 TaxID=2589951 RepID=UPI0011272719|nr:VOC family protein [Mesorhizobium sp. B2-3-13]TPL75270.1 VOC family protein [Mesorhizobium sp. B2-3-13]
MTAEVPSVERIACFSLTTADAEGAARFYEKAFGCRRIAKDRLGGPHFERLMGVSGAADRITLGLGHQTVELLQFELPGEPYPFASSASDLVFQHFAIVVTDIRQAFQRLSTVAGWTPISRGGPQRLPASSGGVTAYKFRDPDGHPLELLKFPGAADSRWSTISPDECCLGIDHSAITVSDTHVSVAYYENLGLSVSACTFNHGPAQESLDDVQGAEVDVIALTPVSPAPHLELLCYRKPHQGPLADPAFRRKANDIASTRLVYEIGRPWSAADNDVRMRAMRDPDDHAYVIEPSRPDVSVASSSGRR